MPALFTGAHRAHYTPTPKHTPTPMDWQDKLITAGALIALVAVILILTL